MGATSVTGTGPGSAEGSNQGSKHMTMGVGRLIGPRVMAAGAQALTGGAATVVLPKLSGVVGDYIVMASNATGAAAACTATLAFGDNDATITLAGTGTNVINWMIVKVGLTV